ncbi:MAG: membrane dipeptidase [Phycisphaerales bacterium]
MSPTPRWFDAHLDLGMLAEKGRDMHASLDDCRGELQPAAVTLPSLRDGHVRACLGTIFTQAVTDPSAPDAEASAFAYPLGDADAAHRAGMRQLKLYQAWASAGVIELMPSRARHVRPSSCLSPTGERAGVRGSPTPSSSSSSPLLLGILIECADPITSPDELDQWVDAGVVAIGMAWWHKSRYAAGNGVEHASDDDGLSDLGRELVKRMDDLGVVHDLSHLSQRSTEQLLELTDAPVIASHSNCRELLDGRDNEQWQRHLADETIAEIGRRGGVVGLNLVRNFIRTGLDRNDPNDRPTIDQAIAHVEHVCEIMGHRQGVGLGSDMDGGITADDLPAGINTPSDLVKLADALNTRGWPDDDIHAFAWGNWARFWNLGG